MSPHLFIAGVPCTGKSLLGGWIDKNCGYIHIDAERAGGADFDNAGVHREWDELIASGRADNFAAAVRHLGKPIVLNWGFPMHFAFVVTALQAARFSAWWFSADRAQARSAFLKRGGIPVALFDRQMKEIERQWLLIERLFGENMINGLHSDGSQREPKELWKEITAPDK
jgi:hypothetical protein